MENLKLRVVGIVFSMGVLVANCGGDSSSTATPPTQQAGSVPPASFDPSGAWNTSLTKCFGATYYSDGGAPVGSQDFDCTLISSSPPEAGQIDVSYNSSTSTVTISGGTSSTPRSFKLDQNQVGFSQRVEFDSSEVSPGCTLTSYLMDGANFDGSDAMTYLVVFDYWFSSGCAPYLSTILNNAPTLFVTLNAYGGLSVQRIQGLTRLVIFLKYQGTKAGSAPSANDGVSFTIFNSFARSVNDVDTLGGGNAANLQEDFLGTLRTMLP